MIRLASVPTGYDSKGFLASMLRSLKDNPDTTDINAKNPNIGEGLTALHHAAMSDNEDIVKALLDRGAKVDLLDTDNALPLHYAVQKPGNVKIVALLLDKMKPSDLELKYVRGITPLSMAVGYKGDLEMIKLLVDRGSKIETKDTYGQTAFSIAASTGRIDVVRYLGNEKGANIDVADNSSKTPLYLAAKGNHVDVVRYLVGRGAWIDIDKQEQDSLGHIFTLRGKITNSEILKLLTKNP